MYPFIVADAHCDTIGELYRPLSLYQSEGHVDVRRMKGYRHYLQFFAVWTDPESRNPLERCWEIIDGFDRQVCANGIDLVQVRTAAEIDSAFAADRAAALLAIEGASCIEKDISLLDAFYERGVRCLSLTWNEANRLAAGAGCIHPGYGLTGLGRVLVRRCAALGIMLDVSHLSERAFWDAAALGLPLLATHSNARALCGHPRNLTDAQFLEIKRLGGVVGLNLYPPFLHESGSAGIDDAIDHVVHFLELGGEDAVCLGTDFDGIETVAGGICGVEDLHLLFERMLERGLGQRIAEKFCYENLRRFIALVCG